MLNGNGLTFTRFIIAVNRTDMRLGIDSLSALIRLRYGMDPLEKGTLFLFCGRKKDRIKGLVWAGDRFIMIYMRLTVLTCKTEENSILSEYCKDSKYNYKRGYIKFTTCRKFKGLESDVIIVVDINKNTFDDGQGEQLMYVGTSRARYKLSCIANMSESDCEELMKERGIKYNRNILKFFATAFNAKVLQK